MKKNKKLVSLHNKAHYLGEKYFSESWAKTCPETPEGKAKLTGLRRKEREQVLL
jgi:hypothetical protein